MRKNISNDPNVTTDLGENDEIVKDVHTRTILSRKKRQAEPEVEIVPATSAVGDIETVDEDEFIIDADESDDEPEFTPGSIGELLTRAEDTLQNSQCNIRVLRKADSPGERFRNPCVSRRSEPPLRNIELTQSRAEIEDIVQAQYGGGHYYLQIQLGNRMLNGWNADLGDVRDDFAASVSAATTQPAAVVPPTPPVNAVNPLQQRIDELKLEKEYDELKFGDERRRLIKLEEQLAEIISQRSAGREPQQSDLALAVSLLRDTKDPHIVDFVKDVINPSEKEDSGGSSFWDFAKYAWDNSEKIMPIVGPLVTSLLSGQQMQQQPLNVAQMMQQQHVPPPVPPPTIPPPAERPFGHLFETPPEPADTEPNTETDAAAIEVVEETEELTEGANG